MKTVYNMVNEIMVAFSLPRFIYRRNNQLKKRIHILIFSLISTFAFEQTEKESFWNAIRQEPERLKEGQHRVYSYVDRGFYANQIERFQAKFSAEQLLFIKYEDFKADQEGTLAKVFSFLGVEHKGFTFTPERIHESAYHSSITPEEREYLKTIFAADIHEVEKLLGWDCTDWLSGT